MVQQLLIRLKYHANWFWLMYLISQGSAQQYSAQFRLVGGTRFENHQGTFGEKGVPNVHFIPGGRSFHSMCVNPMNGKLLVWGGAGLINQKGESGRYEFQVYQCD